MNKVGLGQVRRLNKMVYIASGIKQSEPHRRGVAWVVPMAKARHKSNSADAVSKTWTQSGETGPMDPYARLVQQWDFEPDNAVRAPSGLWWPPISERYDERIRRQCSGGQRERWLAEMSMKIWKTTIIVKTLGAHFGNGNSLRHWGSDLILS